MVKKGGIYIKKEKKASLTTSIIRGLMYLFMVVVIVNFGLNNIFFNPAVAFGVLLTILIINAILELALKRPFNFWDQGKPHLFTNIFLVSLIIFFFIFFSPDQRLWIILFIPLADMVLTVSNRNKNEVRFLQG